MSRIGKKPVPLPKGVTASVSGKTVSVKGPKGELKVVLVQEVDASVSADGITVTPNKSMDRAAAMWGMSRTLVNNLVTGVTTGFTSKLEIQGVGYKAEAKPYGVNLIVGYSHPVKYQAPKGIKISVDNNTNGKIEGADKELVGQVAPELRPVRPPDPYKGKGVPSAGGRGPRRARMQGARQARATGIAQTWLTGQGWAGWASKASLPGVKNGPGGDNIVGQLGKDPMVDDEWGNIRTFK